MSKFVVCEDEFNDDDKDNDDNDDDVIALICFISFVFARSSGQTNQQTN